MKRFIWALGVFVLLTFVGCNLYSSFDKPSGDAQLLSAARAALDAGDWQTALNFYQQVSPAQSDVVNSETAFAHMFADNAGMKQFISSFGKGDNVITGFNNLAGYLALGVGNSGQSRRYDLFNSYKTNAMAITPGTPLQYFTKFILSMVLMGELLSENATTQGTFLMSDIATNPAACLATGTGCGAASCDGPADNVWVAGTAIGSGTLPLDTANPTDFGTVASPISPSAYMMNAAITNAVTAVGLLAPTSSQFNFGTLGTLLSGGAGATAITTDAANLTCFRFALLSAGLGN